MSGGKKRVAYFYDEEVGNFYYGPGHPMKPHRIRMAHNLVLNYGLYKKMEIYRPRLLNEEQMTAFHTDDYIHFLKHVTTDNSHQYGMELDRFNMDVDCPVWDGVYRFCQISAGGSVGGAYKLNRGTADIAINWAGGLHHAKKSEASGFCYVNDIVLAILELLKYHPRVLYIDIDIHHGDGVEEAFYTTNRVMTVSFHKFGEYFPGTGAVNDRGADEGKNYALNFPLHDGMDDDTFVDIFQSIIERVMQQYRPSAVVLQCGADSLSGDRLGGFNLSIRGHGRCVEYVKSFNLPTLVLGGGGYTIRNVARCWAYETGVVLDTMLPDEIPYNNYYEYYGPDFRLYVQPSNMENLNTRQYLDSVKVKLYETLGQIPTISVAYDTPLVTDENAAFERPDEDENNPDTRIPRNMKDAMVDDEKEFFEDDKDQGMELDDQPSMRIDDSNGSVLGGGAGNSRSAQSLTGGQNML